MKHTLLRVLFFCLFSAGIHCPAQHHAQKLDSLFTMLSSQRQFNGNVLIAEGGNIIYQKSFGFSNEAKNEKLVPASIFHLASITKQFTAFAVVLLQEKGLISYNEKISKYLPELSGYADSIAIDHLLHHSSGLPDYQILFDSLWDKRKIATNHDVLALLSRHRPGLLFRAGSKFAYSNTGYLLLAMIIERLSGTSYADFLLQHIFRPLKMNNTFIYTRRLAPRKIPHMTMGYVYSDSLQQDILPDEETHDGVKELVYCFDGIVGQGRLHSTTGDLFLWDRALHRNELISRESMKAIFSPGILSNLKPVNYGFGWELIKRKSFGDIASHSGFWPGYIAYFERHLQNDKTIILLQNKSNDSIKVPIEQIRNILYDIAPLQFITLGEQALALFAGNYKEKGEVKQLTLKNGVLTVVNKDLEFALVPVKVNKFLVKGFRPPVYYEFIIRNNKVEKYVITQEETGLEIEAQKITDFSLPDSGMTDTTSEQVLPSNEPVHVFKDIKLGDALPAFSARDIHGNIISPRDMSGKILVFNFWFIACKPCIGEMPYLNKLKELYKDNEEVVFLSFAKDDPDALLKFLEKDPFSLPVIPGKDMIQQFGIHLFPTNMVFDSSGKLVYKSEGFGGDLEDPEKVINGFFQ